MHHSIGKQAPSGDFAKVWTGRDQHIQAHTDLLWCPSKQAGEQVRDGRPRLWRLPTPLRSLSLSLLLLPRRRLEAEHGLQQRWRERGH